MSPLSYIRRGAASVISSLTLAVHSVTRAVNRKPAPEPKAQPVGGSPFELLVRGLVSAACWVLVLAPFFIVPAYYLLVSLK